VEQQIKNFKGLKMLDKFVFRKNTSDENVIKEILEKKAYSKKKIDFKIEPDDVWLDGGSHIGVFGLYAAQNGAKKVYCYEPETENYKILQENIRHIGTEYSTTLESFQYAINQTGGTHSFTIAPNTWRHSLVTHYKKKLPTIEINCMSFDEILERHRDINCIKLDIEGSELELFQHDHNWTNINKLVFEYSFTKNRKMQDFFDCAERLSKHFHVDIQKSYYNQKHQGQEGYWGGFIDSIIFCKRK
jgi:FkbM family methyltransferase